MDHFAINTSQKRSNWNYRSEKMDSDIVVSHHLLTWTSFFHTSLWFQVQFYTLIYCDRRFVNESYCIYIHLTLPLKIEYTNIFGECVCCISIKILVFKYEKLHFKCTHTICCSILNNMILWLKCQVFPLLAVNWENIFCLAILQIKVIIIMKINSIWYFNEVRIRHQNHGKDSTIIKCFLFANIFLQNGPL